MTKQAALFSYTQARLQAHHGNRLDDASWAMLEAQQTLSSYLQTAQQLPLQAWLAGIHGNDSTHVIERTLAEQFRRHAERVSHWQPLNWRAATRWTAVLPDLPVIAHLLAGGAIPAWLVDDGRLEPLANHDPQQRLSVMMQTPYEPLARHWRPGVSLAESWVAHWKTLWPADSASTCKGVEQVGQVLLRHSEAFASGQKPGAARNDLVQQLSHLFRRYSRQPAAAFAHLGLVALDIERMRGHLVTRAVFASRESEA